jgi:alkylation response protein AidB-like acyl-CoA dehydrogenase
MDFRFSAADEAWRTEVRSWITAEFGDTASKPDGATDEPDADGWAYMLDVRRRLGRKGWTAPAYPKEYGGLGASFAQQAIFNEELAYNRLPSPDIQGVGMVGPTLMLYGTPEQKQHIQKLVRAD